MGGKSITGQSIIPENYVTNQNQLKIDFEKFTWNNVLDSEISKTKNNIMITFLKDTYELSDVDIRIALQLFHIYNATQDSINYIKNHFIENKIWTRDEILCNNTIMKVYRDYLWFKWLEKYNKEEKEKKENTTKSEKIDLVVKNIDKSELFKNISEKFPNILNKKDEWDIFMLNNLIEKVIENQDSQEINYDINLLKNGLKNNFNISLYSPEWHKYSQKFLEIKKLIPTLPTEFNQEIFELFIKEISLENTNK